MLRPVSSMFGHCSARIATNLIHSQLTFTCSKGTIEALKKGAKYAQSQHTLLFL